VAVAEEAVAEAEEAVAEEAAAVAVEEFSTLAAPIRAGGARLSRA
jgi:hypothetical protein